MPKTVRKLKGGEIKMKDNNKKLTQEEKIDMEDLVKELKRLPKEEKEKIYYMVKGAHLVIDNNLSQSKAAI